MSASSSEEAEEADELLATAEVRARLNCPSCGSGHVAQVLGDNGGVSYVCTACGHSWS
jgi:transposase-like protein